MAIVQVLLAVLVQFPIWCYLLYKMMHMVGATELMWFLFWIYVPVGFITQAVGQYLRDKRK